MTCTDNDDFDPLYEATHLPNERVRVKRHDLQGLIDCYASSYPQESRAMVHDLGMGPGKGSLTVNRAALFTLLAAHAKTHAPVGARVLYADPLSALDPGAPPPVAAARARVKGDGPIDTLAGAMKSYLSGPDPVALFVALCKENSIDPVKYAGRNFGLQRMALGNELRNRLKKQLIVTVGGKMVEP